MFARNKRMINTALLLTLGSVIVAAPSAYAAPRAQKAADTESTVEPTTASLLADIKLPDGANRATGSGDLKKFHQALEEVAHTNQGKISRSEVLIWTGDAAKTIVSDVSKRLKEAGYTVAETPSFDSEAGHVTPLAVIRGDKSDSLVGMWIETKDGYALLVWGRFNPDAESASAPKSTEAAPAKPVATTTKVAAAPKKPAAAPKKVASATKPRKSSAALSRTRRTTYRTESAAQRQAKALKAYQDYQYVKLMGPITGPMYRSTKW